MSDQTQPMPQPRPFRVLTLDGGGMRGLYTSSLLRALARFFDQRFLKQEPDLGKAFDLICGTSTGAILACGLAAGIPLKTISNLYIEKGKEIFPSPMPKPNQKLAMCIWSWRHASRAAANRNSLMAGLECCLHDRTLESVYRERSVALCIPCVDALHYRAWVFKTPHHPLKHRDNNYRLVDVCMASTAAPIFFPLSQQQNPDNANALHYFVDGGLWANNPVMIGLVEALTLAERGRPIEIISVGTCDQPAGDPYAVEKTDWGLLQWKVGVKAIDMSLSAQSFGYASMAQFVAKSLTDSGWPISVVRLEEGKKSPEQYSAIGLDRADPIAIRTLVSLAEADAQTIHSDIVGDRRAEYRILRDVLSDLHILETAPDGRELGRTVIAAEKLQGDT